MEGELPHETENAQNDLNSCIENKRSFDQRNTEGTFPHETENAQNDLNIRVDNKHGWEQ